MKTKAVIGAGTMGVGIAVSLAIAGYNVLLYDRLAADPRIRQRAEANIWRFLFVTRNSQRGEIFSRIHLLDINVANEFMLINECDAVIEAIYEDLETKKVLYGRIRGLSKSSGKPPVTIFSNTSTLRCESLVENLEHPEYFMILHFFNPVPMSKVVELVAHTKTSEETMRFGREIVDAINKRVALAPDIPGFVVNRMLVSMLQSFGEKLDQGKSAKEIDASFNNGTWPANADALSIVKAMINKAERLIEDQERPLRLPPEIEALALSAGNNLDDFYGQRKVKLTPEEIDEMVILATGFPQGPFGLKKALADQGVNSSPLKFKMGPGQLADFVGIDIACDCLRMLEFQEPGEWSLPSVFKTVALTGKLGIKAGEGFYAYEVAVRWLMPNKNIRVVSVESSSLSRSVIRRLTNMFKLFASEVLDGVILEIEKVRGADVCEFPSAFNNPDYIKEVIGEWHELMRTIHNFPAPVIAVLRTSALGGGYELALACDYIIAQTRTKVGLPELRLGILPGGGGTQNLPRKVGLAKSLWMILGGEIIEASFPWVDEVTDSVIPSYLEKILEQTKKRSRQAMSFTGEKWSEALEVMESRHDVWRDGQPLSFDLAQDAIFYGTRKNIEPGLDDEMRAILRAFNTADAKEGIIHFLEHGKHKFQIPTSL